MKKFNLNPIAVFLVSLVLLTGCVKDDNFDVPTGIAGITEYPNADAQFNSLSTVLGNFGTGNGDPVTYEEASTTVTEKYTEGYVVSSDEGGNFYKQLVIQDAPENPTAAIVVQVDKNPMFTQYEFGRKVYIKLNGLSVGEANGVIQLGRLEANEIERIPSTLVTAHILRTSEVATIVAKEVSISDFSDALESQYVRLTDMQFNRNEMGLSFASEANDSFDGERVLENCADGLSVILSTSTFSDFKGLTLPMQRGSIDCVLTRDFYDDFYTVYINTPEAINFDNSERCDPNVLECEGSVSSALTVFEEDFQTLTNEAQLDGLGWTNVNVSGGSERFEDDSFSGDTYLKVSAFGTGESPMEAWLVTPAINLDSSTNEELTFDVSANFESGKILSAFITENYTGDPLTTEWIEIDANIPTGGGGFGSFVSSNINISCLNGDVHVAFKYLGAAGSTETRYHIDDIKVTGM